jgi:hypothetical protein
VASDARESIASRFRWQAEWCERLGSPLYADLMVRAADDIEAGGPLWEVLEGHESDAYESMLQLRFAGAVHRLVLAGRAPELAACYPSAGGEAAAEETWRAFRDTVAALAADLRELVELPVQTNEVGRSRALAPAFMAAAAETGLPLRLLEVGSSAGLNLRWDHFRYEGGGWSAGDPDSPVRFSGYFEGAAPEVSEPARVAERLGCDPSPVDPATEEGGLTLRSYLWADQLDRLRLLEAALEVARRVPATVELARASDWLRERLREPADGVCSIVFHSIVMQYVPEDERRLIGELLAAAGARASARAPLARLELEPAGEHADVRLTLWPGGETRVLAHSGYHGAPVEWLG